MIYFTLLIRQIISGMFCDSFCNVSVEFYTCEFGNLIQSVLSFSFGHRQLHSAGLLYRSRIYPHIVAKPWTATAMPLSCSVPVCFVFAYSDVWCHI